MNELLHKQVNAQKENLKKYFRASRELPQAHEKVCDENERNKTKKKNDACIKMLLMVESTL